MNDKKKDELRVIADEFNFLRQLILLRMDDDAQRDHYEMSQTAELIAGRIIAARQTGAAIFPAYHTLGPESSG